MFLELLLSCFQFLMYIFINNIEYVYVTFISVFIILALITIILELILFYIEKHLT